MTAVLGSVRCSRACACPLRPHAAVRHGPRHALTGAAHSCPAARCLSIVVSLVESWTAIRSPDANRGCLVVRRRDASFTRLVSCRPQHEAQKGARSAGSGAFVAAMEVGGSRDEGRVNGDDAAMCAGRTTRAPRSITLTATGSALWPVREQARRFVGASAVQAVCAAA